jgi:hypothetical protein
MVKYESHQNWKWLDQSKFKLLHVIEIMDEQTDKHITQ